ncbi:hypothetical protein MAR_037306, partial [Mya arenaria]
PEGVVARSRHKLIRRIYRNKGPNVLVPLDEYDKIKRYGLAIHGAIDGWVLTVSFMVKNNDPKILASYFLEFVTEAEGAPRCIRMDAGCEANMQKSFRWFHGYEMAGEKGVVIGSSPSNQKMCQILLHTNISTRAGYGQTRMERPSNQTSERRRNPWQARNLLPPSGLK